MFRDSSSKLYMLCCDHLVEVDCEYPVTEIKYVNRGFYLLDDRGSYHVVQGGSNVNLLNIVTDLPIDVEHEGCPQFTLDNNSLTCISDPIIMEDYRLPDDPIDGVRDYRVCYEFVALLTIDKKVRLFIRKFGRFGASKLVSTFTKGVPDRTSILPFRVNYMEEKDCKPDRAIMSGGTIDISGVEQIEMYGNHLFLLTIDGTWRVGVSDTFDVNNKLYYLSYIERSDQYNIQLSHSISKSSTKNAAKRI